MNPDDLKNLQGMLKKFNSTNISTEEFQAALSDIVNAFAQHRSAFKELSTKSEESMSQALQNLQAEFDKMRADMDGGMTMTKGEIDKMIKSALSDVKKAIGEVEMLEPLHGKDADEEKIVGEVLAKIKLPEYKETVLDTGETIVDKINALDTSEENQIDAKHIKNLPQLKQEIVQEVRRGVSQRVVAGTGITITTDGNGQQVIGASGGAGLGDVVGPVSATDSNFAAFDTTTGKLIKDSTKSAASFAPALGADDNYVTDAQLVVIGNTSGTNTGNQTITNSSDATSHTVTLSATGGSVQLIEGTGITLTTGGTGSAGTVTIASTGGSGTVTASGGNLTANAVVLGAGTTDTKVSTGITTDGASALTLGVNATTIGKVKMFGNTSGDATIQPTAAAGTATVQTLPATTGTLVNRVTTANGVSASNSDGALTVSLGAITPTTVNGHTFTTGSSTFTGTAGQTYTFPSTSKTVAANDGSNMTLASQAIGDIITASSTTAFNRLADVATGSVLVSGGVGVAPAYSANPAVTTLELGAGATDTTLSRASAGVLAVEGVNVLTTATGLALSGGTMTGNITLGENTSIDLDPAGSADGKYSGICITGTAGATLAFGDLIYLAVADSRWELTDADATATAGTPLIGMCVLAAAADGNATKILLHGTIRADAKFPALTIGAPAYVGETAGAIQVAIPTGADNVIRIVGRALTADELYFCPSQDHQISVA